MKKIKLTLLSTLSIAVIAISSCGNMPIEPHDPIFQPIVEQKFCTNPEYPETCEVKSLCREYRYDGKLYFLYETHPLKKCSGTFGQDAPSFNRKKDYIRELLSWIKTTCKVK